ncbi:MAG: VIT domain-containing protein [Anaerolineae bacterium]|nr:VIT domain-containing protein [Anaerolineae bacterium]MDW8069944.1 VIT domain-containing protein [Anaerolineae bacterium]
MCARWLLIGLITLGWILTTGAPAAADGIIIPDTPVTSYLNVKYHRVTVTIQDQVAVTYIDQVFVNDTGHTVEGSYLFPLPEEAAISEFTMWVDGQPVSGQILTREEARRRYDEIVRGRRDPALLEYVGRDLFQASIFPMAPGEERRVELEYAQVLSAENGLVRYVYPLSPEKFSPQPLQDASIYVSITSRDPIKAVYSPSHPVAIDRQGDKHVRVGWEARNVKPDKDFVLFYSVSQQELSVNLLTYKARGEDGFFLLLITPQLQVESERAVAKDVVLVLDTSGSMEGEKLEQAKDALVYILQHLNPQDRFNIVRFSTGVQLFAEQMRPAAEAQDGIDFVRTLGAAGGTNIDGALREALRITTDPISAERPVILIFLTDGLPTEGEVEISAILANVKRALRPNVRIFAFGVGDDVNTVLLDNLTRDTRGASAYVRPGERIDEQVSALYAKVSVPVLANVALDVAGVRVYDLYPSPLPDLFAGSQLAVVGRYYAGGVATLTLRGTVNNQVRTFTYRDLAFRDFGGEDFIPPLWATRKIGYLLNEIRLHGESQELIQQIVNLSVRYGIITPYTSFLVEEPVRALSEAGRTAAAADAYLALQAAAPAPQSGAAAVEESIAQSEMEKATLPGAPTDTYSAQVRTVGERAFVLRDGVWTDTTFDPTRMTPVQLVFGSHAFSDFLTQHPEAGRYFALGAHVIVVIDGTAYEMITPSAGYQPVSQDAVVGIFQESDAYLFYYPLVLLSLALLVAIWLL